jgi:hypothetical protein
VIIGLFFFVESTVTKETYLDTLRQFAAPLVEDLQATTILKQDDPPPHCGRAVRGCLNETLPVAGYAYTAHLPGLPDLQTSFFFLALC